MISTYPGVTCETRAIARAAGRLAIARPRFPITVAGALGAHPRPSLFEIPPGRRPVARVQIRFSQQNQYKRSLIVLDLKGRQQIGDGFAVPLQIEEDASQLNAGLGVGGLGGYGALVFIYSFG
jgi:hypothetical protein